MEMYELPSELLSAQGYYLNKLGSSQH